MVTLLNEEHPELVKWFDSPLQVKFGVDPLAAVWPLAAIMFFLRSHIKFKDGKFTFEYKPMDSDLLKIVLDKLGQLFSIK